MSASSPGRATVRGMPLLSRRTIRSIAVGASALTALLYFGIGAGLLKVVDQTGPDSPDLVGFGVAAGTAFALGAGFLLAFDRRVVWLLGAVLQVGVIVVYIAIAPQRNPPFELWGILIKVLQATILAALVYLLVRRPQPELNG